MSNNVDLHCHSTASDGALSPQAVVERALANGAGMLALTDHDSVAGFSSIPSELGARLELIPGAEFSTRWESLGVHVVGLRLNLNGEALHAALAAQTEVRQKRAVEIAQALKRAGLPDLLEAATARAGDGVVGRPHFARELVARGLVGSMEQAFRRYLGQGRPGDVHNAWPGMLSTISNIHAADGVAVLAHPLNYRLSRRQRQRLIAAFKAAGGDAVEVVSGRQDPEQTRMLARDATAVGLAGSIGSDFHAPTHGGMDVGATGPLPVGVRPVWELFQ